MGYGQGIFMKIVYDLLSHEVYWQRYMNHCCQQIAVHHCLNQVTAGLNVNGAMRKLGLWLHLIIVF